jgi:hypothetical protein
VCRFETQRLQQYACSATRNVCNRGQDFKGSKAVIETLALSSDRDLQHRQFSIFEFQANVISIADQATFNSQITGMHAENWVCRQSLEEGHCISTSAGVNPDLRQISRNPGSGIVRLPSSRAAKTL